MEPATDTPETTEDAFTDQFRQALVDNLTHLDLEFAKKARNRDIFWTLFQSAILVFEIYWSFAHPSMVVYGITAFIAVIWAWTANNLLKSQRSLIAAEAKVAAL